MDFLTIFSNAVLIITYIPCAILVDKFGIRMMWVGNGMLALSTVGSSIYLINTLKGTLLHVASCMHMVFTIVV